jgi:uncharacterized protein
VVGIPNSQKLIAATPAKLWPAGRLGGLADAPREVRFLAPFDPTVWDRRRLEHLWGWTYRFEAYVPERNRRRGYYAMPLLWMDRDRMGELRA